MSSQFPPAGRGYGGYIHFFIQPIYINIYIYIFFKTKLTSSPWRSRSYIFSTLELECYARFFVQDIWHSVFRFCTRGLTQQWRCRRHRSTSESFRSEENDIYTDHTLLVSCRMLMKVNSACY